MTVPRDASRLIWTLTARDDTRPRGEQTVAEHPCPDLWQALVLAVVVREFWPALRVSLTRHWSPTVADRPAQPTGPVTTFPTPVSATAFTGPAPAALTVPRGERSTGSRNSADSVSVSAQPLTGVEGPDNHIDRRVAA